MRTLPSPSTSAIAQANVGVVIFVEMDFASGFVRVCSAGHSMSALGETFLGVGRFGEIEPVREGEGGEVSGLSFDLSGVPSQYIATALGEQYQGRAVRVYVGFLALPNHSMVADPTLEWEGRMDTMTVVDEGGTSRIQVKAEHELYDAERPNTVNWSDEEQQRRFPGDLFLQYVAQMSTREIVWPAASFGRQ